MVSPFVECNSATPHAVDHGSLPSSGLAGVLAHVYLAEVLPEQLLQFLPMIATSTIQAVALVVKVTPHFGQRT
jgi:hypothetical protein